MRVGEYSAAAIAENSTGNLFNQTRGVIYLLSIGAETSSCGLGAATT